jgi:hypothetical protein
MVTRSTIELRFLSSEGTNTYKLLHIPFFLSALQHNSGLGRLHATFCYTSVTRLRTISRTPWTGDQLVARPLYLYKNTEKRTYNTNTKHPCPEWASYPRSRSPRQRRPLGYRDRHIYCYLQKMFIFSIINGFIPFATSYNVFNVDIHGFHTDLYNCIHSQRCYKLCNMDEKIQRSKKWILYIFKEMWPELWPHWNDACCFGPVECFNCVFESL